MHAIEIRALRKRFGKFLAVDDISFNVAEGENFGLLGPNGAGKSTLIRMLTTLMTPTSGTAFVAGHDIRRDAAAVRRSIGMVPQYLTSDPNLTAAENLVFHARLYDVPGRRRRTMVEELLEAVNLSEWRDKMVGTFSGGMRRRLEIARSLVHRPQVLFLDEPTSGLDPASRLAMWEMIRHLKSQSGLTIFLTTHYMEEADELCDRVAIFDHGKVVALDTPSYLKSQVASGSAVEVEFAAIPDGWLESLRQLPGVEDVEMKNGLCQIGSRDSLTTLTALADRSRASGVSIVSMALKGGTLEDVFIRYTGRDLRDSAEGSNRLDIRHFYEGPRN